MKNTNSFGALFVETAPSFALTYQACPMGNILFKIISKQWMSVNAMRFCCALTSGEILGASYWLKMFGIETKAVST